MISDHRCYIIYCREILKGSGLVSGMGSHCKSAKFNMLSADTNPQVVTSYLQEQVALAIGRVVRPLPLGSIPMVWETL